MRNRSIIIGFIMLALMIIVALAGPYVVDQLLFPGERPGMRGSYRPYQLDSATHPIGTDGDGRDGLMVFVSSIWPSLQIGVIAGATSTSLGVVIGFLAGYARGRLDTLARILIDMVLVIPTLPLLLMLAAYIDRWDLYKLSLILGLFGWSFVARVIRPQVQSLRERSYVDLAVLSGENPLEIVFLELLPPLLPYIGYVFSLSIVGSMLAEAGLQIIGLGAGGLPTLGFMIAKGFRESVIAIGLLGQMLLPAGALIYVFLALNLINTGLDEVFNPRLKTTIEGGE